MALVSFRIQVWDVEVIEHTDNEFPNSSNDINGSLEHVFEELHE